MPKATQLETPTSNRCRSLRALCLKTKEQGDQLGMFV